MQDIYPLYPNTTQMSGTPDLLNTLYPEINTATTAPYWPRKTHQPRSNIFTTYCWATPLQTTNDHYPERFALSARDIAGRWVSQNDHALARRRPLLPRVLAVVDEEEAEDQPIQVRRKDKYRAENQDQCWVTRYDRASRKGTAKPTRSKQSSLQVKRVRTWKVSHTDKATKMEEQALRLKQKAEEQALKLEQQAFMLRRAHEVVAEAEKSKRRALRLNLKADAFTKQKSSMIQRALEVIAEADEFSESEEEGGDVTRSSTPKKQIARAQPARMSKRTRSPPSDEEDEEDSMPRSKHQKQVHPVRRSSRTRSPVSYKD